MPPTRCRKCKPVPHPPAKLIASQRRVTTQLTRISAFSLFSAASTGLSGVVWGQKTHAAKQPPGGETRQCASDDNQALAGWTITGDVTIDMTKGRPASEPREGERPREPKHQTIKYRPSTDSPLAAHRSTVNQRARFNASFIQGLPEPPLLSLL